MKKASDKSKLNGILKDVRLWETQTEDPAQTKGLNKYMQHRILEKQDDIFGDTGETSL